MTTVAGSNGLTVTSTLAETPPAFVVAVIVVVPSPTAVTVPSLPTVATEVFDDSHVTSVLMAFSGETVAVSFVALFSTMVSAPSSTPSPTIVTLLGNVTSAP